MAVTSGNDQLRGNGGTTVLAGGAGDDTYYVSYRGDTVFEAPNAGYDKVASYRPYHVLADNVEELVVGLTGAYGGGNGLANLLRATAAGQTLDGSGGNDTLVGGVKTTFVVNRGDGSDTILNWSADDTVRLNGFGLSNFAEVRSILSQSGANAVLDFANGQRLTLQGVNAGRLRADNFQLERDTAGDRLSFSDNFDVLSLYNPVDRSGTWRTEFGYGGAGTNASRMLNHELEIYMDARYGGTSGKALGIDPFSLDNGTLTITAAPTPASALNYLSNRPYTSGLLTTRFSFAQEYGYFEIRTKLPDAKGFWPAFWLLPTDGTWPPEIDVFEQLGSDPTTVYLTSHGPGKSGDQDVVHLETTKYHTYGVDWGPSVLKFYIDGVQVAEQATPAIMRNKEMYMLLNLAVGGLAGTPEHGARAQMQVDYVRAYATTSTVSMTVNGIHLDAASGPATQSPATPPSAPVVPPVANADQGANAKYSTPLTLSSDWILANDVGDGLKLTSVDQASHGTVSLVNGKAVFAPEAFYSGAASFEYTVTDQHGHTDRARVSVTIAPEDKPASTYVAGSSGNDVFDKSASSYGWMIAGGNGNDRLLGGNAVNSLNGGSGNDTIVGGAGNDVITGGRGIDLMTGGGGRDTFIISAGDLVWTASGSVDTIADFHAGASDPERDALRLQGFSAGARLTVLGNEADGAVRYHVADGVNSGDLVVQSHGIRLTSTDFVFV